MEPIQNLLGPALERVEQQTKTPRSSTADVFPFDWKLMGNETDEEATILSLMVYEANRFCNDVQSGADPRWLSLVGFTGCGKTYLARQICGIVKTFIEEVYNRLHPANNDPERLFSYAQEGPLFTRWVKVLALAREGQYAPSRRCSSDYFKCIDDVGAEGLSQSGEAYAFSANLIGKIADDRVGKWTVLTSNLTRRQIAETLDPRIASRMGRDGSVIVEATGVRDYTIRKEKALADLI